jgi:hypothetical protein
MVVHACHPTYEGGVGKRITVGGQPQTKSWNPTWKITTEKKKKKGWNMAQVVEHLSSNCKFLSSNPSTAEKKKNPVTCNNTEDYVKWVKRQNYSKFKDFSLATNVPVSSAEEVGFIDRKLSQKAKRGRKCRQMALK